MARLSSLAELAARPADGRAVGLEPGRDWSRLARRRAAWRAALDPEGAGGSAPVAVHLSDGFECAAALLAAWSLGRPVILPGDERSATRAALRPRAARLFIGDADVPPEPPVPPPPAPVPLVLPAAPVLVFTSGSTGDPVAMEKPLACLENELKSLEAAFGEGLEGTAVLSTVSHQHYYGLLFRLLWPLAAGRPFLGRRLETPEELAAEALVHRPWGRFALVSSPALLKRIGATLASLEALAPIRPKLAAVFSSGGPLPWDAVLRCRAALGRTPTEVYGSSETGGVAWRRREKEGDPYLPLPGVETALDVDGVLTLRSGHLPGAGWTRGDDRAAFEGEGPGFHLLGRADRIVKIEEKRVSLEALERGLAGHPEVLEARVLPLPGERDVLGAVVRLKSGPPQGVEARRAAVGELRALLSGLAEPVALPRRWRFVEALPEDAMGKASQAALRSLFDEPESREPELLLLRRTDAGVELDFRLPEGLRWFKGHFPGRPLLPGVAQLHWAMLAAREHLGLQGPFKGLRVLKFTRPLLPGQRVTLSLAPAPGGFEFRYVSGEGRHAGGHVLLA